MRNIITLPDIDYKDSFEVIMSALDKESSILLRIPGEFTFRDVSVLLKSNSWKVVDAVCDGAVAALVSGDMFIWGTNNIKNMQDYTYKAYTYCMLERSGNKLKFSHLFMHFVFKEFGYDYAKFVKCAPTSCLTYTVGGKDPAEYTCTKMLLQMIDHNLAEGTELDMSYISAEATIEKFKKYANGLN